MAWSNSLRLICMLTFTFGFFVVELVVSQITGSLTLLADSFHMLSDVIAQIVALFAMRLAGRTQSTDRNTYGWVRAEVMGALVNAVFLYALCATIVMEATERIFEPHEIDNPPLLLAVGILGLLVNLIGIFLFRHGGHSHSHGGHSHGNKNKSKKNNSLTGKETKALSPYADKDNVSQGSGTAQLNIRGVFLHVLGDFMVSVVVVFNALIFTYVWQPCVEGEDCINPCYSGHDGHSTGHNGTLHLGPFTKMAGPCWVLYMEPCLVFITVGLMLYFTYPLLKEAMLILLQTVPKQIDVNGLNERLLGLDGVLAIHELHIWQLAGSRVIATAHVKCHDPSSYMDVAKRIKDFFHHEGIHATTIQPEFVTFNSESRDCELPCQTQCAPSLCCSNGENGAEQDAAQEP